MLQNQKVNVVDFLHLYGSAGFAMFDLFNSIFRKWDHNIVTTDHNTISDFLCFCCLHSVLANLMTQAHLVSIMILPLERND